MVTLLKVATLLGGITPCLGTDVPYSVTQFVADCRISGGAPRLFSKSVVCHDRGRADVICKRLGARVKGCGLGSIDKPPARAAREAAAAQCIQAPRP